MPPIPRTTASSEVDAATEDAPCGRVAAVVEPTEDLLGRALIGWERFVSTFEGAVNE
ncbi:hypothetical protein [Streptomyces sp. NPDC054787]